MHVDKKPQLRRLKPAKQSTKQKPDNTGFFLLSGEKDVDLRIEAIL